MAASFYVTEKKKNGYATVFVRLQCKPQGVDIKMKTPIEVEYEAFKRYLKGKGAVVNNYKAANKEITDSLEDLRLALEQTETRKKGATKEEVKEIIDSVIFRRQREEEAKKEEPAAAEPVAPVAAIPPGEEAPTDSTAAAPVAVVDSAVVAASADKWWQPAVDELKELIEQISTESES